MSEKLIVYNEFCPKSSGFMWILLVLKSIRQNLYYSANHKIRTHTIIHWTCFLLCIHSIILYIWIVFKTCCIKKYLCRSSSLSRIIPTTLHYTEWINECCCIQKWIKIPTHIASNRHRRRIWNQNKVKKESLYKRKRKEYTSWWILLQVSSRTHRHTK